MVDTGAVSRLLLGLGFTIAGLWLLVRTDQTVAEHRRYYWFYPMVQTPYYPWMLRMLGASCVPVGILLAVSSFPGIDLEESSSQYGLLIDVPAYFAGIFFVVIGMGLWIYADEVHALYRQRFPFIPTVETRFYRWLLRLNGAFIGVVGMAIAFGILL